MSVPMKCLDCGTRFESTELRCPVCAARERVLLCLGVFVLLASLAASVWWACVLLARPF